MSEIILISIIVAAAASVGGLISIYAKEEMEQYEKQINYFEMILSLIPLFFIFLIYKGFIPVIFLVIGIITIFILTKSLFHDLFDKYTRTIIFGIILGILLSFQRNTAFIFGTFVALYNIIKGSKIGHYYKSKRVNIFKKIGNFQALFIISALLGFYLLSFPIIRVFVLYFSVGVIITLTFKDNKKN